MELVLLGTAAAEGWPAPFCLCGACETARKIGGPNVRTRSGALIDDELKIDFGPDTVMQLQRCGRNLTKVRTLIFTHQHSDHFIASELEWAAHPFTLTPPQANSIELCGNAQVLADIARTFAGTKYQLPFVFREFKAGDQLTTVAGEEVWAMPAQHVEGACLLRIRRNGKTILYGHDSGAYPAETLERLSDGMKLDIALIDCTYGSTDSDRGHLGCAAVVRTVGELRKRGAIGDSTRIIATHFSHGGKWMHQDLVRYFMSHGIEVAYDGMVVNA